MKQLLWNTALVTLLSPVVLILVLVGPTPRASQALTTSTAACGSINTNTTWTVISSPYVVCASGVTVGPTATLTIQPGVTAQFQPGVNARRNVQGALTAIGAATQPITFTGVVVDVVVPDYVPFLLHVDLPLIRE